jgi:hypothetical protein
MNEAGVSFRVLEDTDGEPLIQVSIGGAWCVLPLHKAMSVFEDLGGILAMLGVFDDDETEVPRCH